MLSAEVDNIILVKENFQELSKHMDEKQPHSVFVNIQHALFFSVEAVC